MSCLHGKNIIIVLDCLELGGAERQALSLAMHLINKEGASVKILAFSRKGKAADLCDNNGIFWEIFPIDWNYNNAYHKRYLAKKLLRL